MDVCKHRGARRGGKLGRIAPLLRSKPIWPVAPARAQPDRLRRAFGAPGRAALLVEQRTLSSQSGQFAALRLRNDNQQGHRVERGSVQ